MSGDLGAGFAEFLAQELRNLETKLKFAYSCEVSRLRGREEDKSEQLSNRNGTWTSPSQPSQDAGFATSSGDRLSPRLGPDPSTRRLTDKVASISIQADTEFDTPRSSSRTLRESTSRELSEAGQEQPSMFGGSETPSHPADVHESVDSLPSCVHEVFLRAHVDENAAEPRLSILSPANKVETDGPDFDASRAKTGEAGEAEETESDAGGQASIRSVRIGLDDEKQKKTFNRSASDTWMPSPRRRPTGFGQIARRMSIMSSTRSDEEQAGKSDLNTLEARTVPRRSVQVGDVMLEDGFFQRLVGLPGSKYRIIWDVTGVLFVAYDGFMIPFMQAFHKTEIGSTLSMLMLVSTVFWTLDIPMSFSVGYHVEGLIEMRMSRIGKRYVKTWFFPDICIVSLDWAFILLGLTGAPSASNDNSAGIARVARTVRVFRMLRIVRLLRLPKLFRKMRELHARIGSELLRVCFQMWGIMGIMIILTHFVACGWYAVGICMWGDIVFCDGTAAAVSWTHISFNDPTQDSLMYRYTTSLQWAAAQFAVGTSDVVATCFRERVFAVFSIWFGLIAFSVFVSSITTNMTQLRQINSEQFNDEEGLKMYLVEHRVSVELGRCIMEYFNVHRREKKLQAREVDRLMLQTMPDGLRRQLSLEIFMPIVTSHPFFRFLREVDFARLGKLCHKAMHEIRLVVKEELFNVGDLSKGLYFLNKGSLCYNIAPEVLSLHSGQWIAEATLWMSRWMHCGRLSADDNKAGADVIRMDAEEFRDLMRGAENMQDVKGLRYGAAYAVSFVHLQCEGTAEVPFRRTDIWGTRAELTETACRAAEGTLYEWRGSGSKEATGSVASSRWRPSIASASSVLWQRSM